MILSPLNIHVMQQSQLDMQCDGNINQHEGDVFVALDLQYGVGKVASSEFFIW